MIKSNSAALFTARVEKNAVANGVGVFNTSTVSIGKKMPTIIDLDGRN